MLSCDDSIAHNSGRPFYDPGHKYTALKSLEDYKREKVDLQQREVFVLNEKEDPNLRNLLVTCKQQIVAAQCSSRKSMFEIIANSVYQFYGGVYQGAATLLHSKNEVMKLKQRFQSNVIHAGALITGVPYHRAILFKYLCDSLAHDLQLELPCKLTRVVYVHNLNTCSICLHTVSVVTCRIITSMKAVRPGTW